MAPLLGMMLRPVANVFSVVAVPPVAVFVNKSLNVPVFVLFDIVTPDPTPAGPRGTTRDKIGAEGFVTSIVALAVG
jgi:hypothetical protein